MLIINIFLIAATAAPDVAYTSPNSFPAEVSSRIAEYLLVSEACDKMLGTNAAPEAQALAVLIVREYGYTYGQVDRMIGSFISENVDEYTASIREAAGGSVEAIRYFCTSTINEKRNVFETNKAFTQP